MRKGDLVRLGRGNLELYVGDDTYPHGPLAIGGMLFDSELLLFLGLHPARPHLARVVSPSLGIGYVQLAWIEVAS